MINLEKDQKIDLAKKDGTSLDHILFGLGWDEAGKSGGGKGFLGLFRRESGTQDEIDIDASVFLVQADGRIHENADMIYYGNRKHPSGSVVHQGDNLVGGKMDGMEDSEQIDVFLSKVPSRISKLIFVVNIYQCVPRRQHFGMVRNAYIRIVDQASREQMAAYNLTDDYSGMTSITVGEAVREGSGWTFRAVGAGGRAKSVSEMANDCGR